VPDGRAANQPFRVTTFSPPIDAPFPGAFVIFAMIGSPASSLSVRDSAVSFLKAAFSSGVIGVSTRRVVKRPELGDEVRIVAAGSLPVRANDLRGQEARG